MQALLPGSFTRTTARIRRIGTAGTARRSPATRSRPAMTIFFAEPVALSKTFPIFAPDFALVVVTTGRRSLRRVKK